MIDFQQISKHYGDKHVLKACNLSIRNGEFFVLVGPSGSGKTTMLKMINRLIEPTSGEIYFHRKRLKKYHRRQLRLSMGYVLQQIALFPNMTVAENIELIPEMQRWHKTSRRERTLQLLHKVNLDPDHYLHRKPAELSGGEQQRIGILRAIAAKPDIILMDEPFSALDPISRQQLQVLIKDLHRDLESTIVFVTHDMNEALLLGDRICIMNAGKIVQIDTPEQIQANPANMFVAQFFSQSDSLLEKSRVQDMHILGLLESTSLQTANQTVSLSTALTEVITFLAAGHTVNVIEHGNYLGHITEHMVMCFLDQKISQAAYKNEHN